MARTKKNEPETAAQKLLSRVTVEDAPEQEEAGTVAIDRVTKTAHVKVNPEQVDAQARHGHHLRGAAQLVLSGFDAYHRDIQRKYGSFPSEQAVFDRERHNAQQDLEALLHELAPYTPEPAPTEG